MQTVDGNRAKLSALKGNVVVLDIWATWCGPCRAMIPHEREMVERLKDKPFQLVGISIDDDVKKLKDFLSKQKLPWTHWWAGPGKWEAAIAQEWDIRSIPAIFVLDAKGVIRYKNLRGEEAREGRECAAGGKARGGCGAGVEPMSSLDRRRACPKLGPAPGATSALRESPDRGRLGGLWSAAARRRCHRRLEREQAPALHISHDGRTSRLS